MKAILEDLPNLSLKQANINRLIVEGDHVTGVETNIGLRFLSSSVVVTTGTFMRGLLHVGMQTQAGGRMGDTISTLSDHLKELGFEVGRFKTGTRYRRARRLHQGSPTFPRVSAAQRMTSTR
jgi:tRNA uridine 5-carboxymethylaminomethyl modification enzyme